MEAVLQKYSGISMTFITIAAVLSALAGVLVGLRLTVLVLVPGIAVTILLIVTAGGVCGYSFGATLAALVSGMIGMQGGYIAGVAARCWVSIARSSALLPNEISTSSNRVRPILMEEPEASS